MPPFTPTQARYLSFIHAYTEGFGVPPSEAEIASAMKVQPPSVSGMLKTMVKKGLVQKTPGEARSIEILIDSQEIPRWKKKINSTMRFWAPMNASSEALDQIGDEIIRRRKAERAKQRNLVATKNSSSPDTIYRFKISLCKTKPPIWRRIETHDATIEQFNELIQTAMGWTNSHLHDFEFGGSRYTHPRLHQDGLDDFGSESYAGKTISEWIEQSGGTLKVKFRYDFGDGWEHDIVLEATLPAEANVEYPRCVTGKLACPPEDCGGVWSYYDLLEALSDPEHERHEDLLEWVGAFNPTHFDPTETTDQMQRGLPSSF